MKRRQRQYSLCHSEHEINEKLRVNIKLNETVDRKIWGECKIGVFFSIGFFEIILYILSDIKLSWDSVSKLTVWAESYFFKKITPSVRDTAITESVKMIVPFAHAGQFDNIYAFSHCVHKRSCKILSSPMRQITQSWAGCKWINQTFWLKEIIGIDHPL